eukprot:jgi/Picre1/27288/NNA_000257.t1
MRPLEHTKERQEEHIMAIRRKEDPIIREKGGSVQDCFKKCAKSSKCGSFTYTPSKKYCTLSKRDVAHSSGEVSKNSVKICQKSGRYAGYISSGGGSSSSGGGITMDQVKSKRWTIIDNKVYDLTSFARIHPGGRDKIIPYFGRDASSAFNGGPQHGAPSGQSCRLSLWEILHNPILVLLFINNESYPYPSSLVRMEMAVESSRGH